MINLNMKHFTIPLLLVTFNAIANDDATIAVKNDPYINNKALVVQEAQRDCVETVNLTLQSTPQSIKNKVGTDNLKRRTMFTCSYSLGSVQGERLFHENRTTTYTPTVTAEETLSKLYTSMSACAELTKSGEIKDDSDFIYCMYKNGAIDGFVYEQSKTSL